jgi:uncharacterized protein (TIGR03435 family)
MRAALALLASCVGFAQTPQAQFDAASIKPSGLIENGSFVGGRGGPGTEDPGRYTCTYCYLSMVITEAYDIPYYRLSGINRLPDRRFHFVATIPRGTTREQFHQMLQNLLAERFKLSVHRETREMETLRLVVADGGPKLKAYVEGEPPMERKMSGAGMYYQEQGRTMGEFADYASGYFGRPVIDDTGLRGKYDFNIWFNIDPDTLASTGSPTLPGAIRSLGLKVEPRKGQVEFLVVDHAEKTPTEN